MVRYKVVAVSVIEEILAKSSHFRNLIFDSLDKRSLSQLLTVNQLFLNWVKQYLDEKSQGESFKKILQFHTGQLKCSELKLIHQYMSKALPLLHPLRDSLHVNPYALSKLKSWCENDDLMKVLQTVVAAFPDEYHERLAVVLTYIEPCAVYDIAKMVLSAPPGSMVTLSETENRCFGWRRFTHEGEVIEDVGLFKHNQLEIGYRQATVRALTKHVVGIFDDNEALIFGVKYDEEDRHKGHFKDNQLVKGVEECKDRTYGSYRMMVYQIEHHGDGTKTKYYKQELDLSHSIKKEHGVFKCGRWGEFLKKGRKDYYKAELSGWNPGIVTEIGEFDRIGRLKMGRLEFDVGRSFFGARTIRFIYGVPFPYYSKTFK